MDRIDVKTLAKAEAAIAKGQAINIIAGEFVLTIASGHADIAVAPGVSASVEAHGSARVEASGFAHVVAWDSAIVEAWDSAIVVAWGSASVVAYGSASVAAYGSARVKAWDSTSVAAHGYCFIDHRSDVPARASAHVSVNLWNGATCEGGRQQVVSLATAQDWCEYYGARIEDGNAIVYKAVGADYKSRHGVTYEPGTMPTDPAWDGKGREFAKGGGLDFSPTPRHTHKFVTSPAHYLECRIALDEMVVHFEGSYPEKCCAPRVVAPLVEVDVDGVPVAVTEEAA